MQVKHAKPDLHVLEQPWQHHGQHAGGSPQDDKQCNASIQVQSHCTTKPAWCGHAQQLSVMCAVDLRHTHLMMFPAKTAQWSFSIFIIILILLFLLLL